MEPEIVSKLPTLLNYISVNLGIGCKEISNVIPFSPKHALNIVIQFSHIIKTILYFGTRIIKSLEIYKVRCNDDYIPLIFEEFFVILKILLEYS